MNDEYRQAAIEEFWGGEDDEVMIHCRGAQVISYLNLELESLNELLEVKENRNDADVQLRKSFIEVLNFIADCTDNEDMRVQEVVDNE